MDAPFHSVEPIFDTPEGVVRLREALRRISRTCMRTGQMLMRHGAESALAENLTLRMGRALGAEQVHVGLTANFVTVTVRSRLQSLTDVRRIQDGGINMQVVSEVQRTVLALERGEIPAEPVLVFEKLDAIVPFKYPKALVCVMVGLSCAAFGRMMGGDWGACALACVAAGVAMSLRLWIARWHFNPLVNFALTAFLAESIACWGTRLPFVENPETAMAASVLLLIPGYPMINCVSDMVKGYVNTGLSRGVFALLLILASTVGIFLALTLWRAQLWI